MIVVNPVKQKDVKLSVYILSSLENCKYYYKTSFSLLRTAVHQDTKALLVFVFFLSQSNRFSSLLAGHICVAALNTPGLFPSKVVASELTGKTCSEQAEAAS